MYPAKWYFRKHEEEPTTEVGIRRTFAEDLYIVMPAFELQDQTASVEVHINPLVNWVWFGFGIMAIGTGIALLPERAFSFADGAPCRPKPPPRRCCAGAPARAGAGPGAARETAARRPARRCSRRKSRRHEEAGLLVRRLLEAAGGRVLVRPLRAGEERSDAR